MRNVVVSFVLLLSACGTEKNRDACCVDEADCASVGLPAGSTCEDGRTCRNNRCIELPCERSSECDALEPYCGGESCQATCSDDAECPGFGQSSTQKFCTGACVECRDAADCGTSAPVCDQGACRACVVNDDCASGVCTQDGSCAAEAAIAYAAPNGSGASACLRADPCNLARAVEPTINRRYVVLASGTYQLPATMTLEGLRSFIGAKGTKPALTITGLGPILRLGSGSDITFDNIEARGARPTSTSAFDGFAIECPSTFQKASLRVTRSVFTQNQTGAISARQCNLEIRDSTFMSNARGIEVTDGMSTIERSTFALNTETALYLDAGLHTVENNFIVRNARGLEVSLTTAGTKIEFNTIADNAGTGVDCGSATSTFVFPANLVTGNGTNVDAEAGCSFTGSLVLDDASLVRYKSATTQPYDYHLTAGSIAVDQVPTSTQVRDVDNETRPYGAGHDFGADELH